MRHLAKCFSLALLLLASCVPNLPSNLIVPTVGCAANGVHVVVIPGSNTKVSTGCIDIKPVPGVPGSPIPPPPLLESPE